MSKKEKESNLHKKNQLVKMHFLAMLYICISEKLAEHNKRTKLPQLSELNLFKYPKIEYNLTTVNTKPIV